MTIKLPERDPRMLLETRMAVAIKQIEDELNVRIAFVQIEHNERGVIIDIRVVTEEAK